MPIPTPRSRLAPGHRCRRDTPMHWPLVECYTFSRFGIRQADYFARVVTEFGVPGPHQRSGSNLG